MITSLRLQHALLRVCVFVFVVFTATMPSIAVGKPDPGYYQLLFEVDLTRKNGFAAARISVRQTTELLREVRLRAPTDLYKDFSGDGTIRRDGTIVIWQPPPDGGSIHYIVLIDHQRASGDFDALVTDDWAVFRGDDVFPPASITQRAGVRATSEFSARLPADWSIVTPFANAEDDRLLIDNPDRNFDRPVGWMIAGHLGVRRDNIAGMEVSIAGPTGVGIQRISMLALLRWTLPLLVTEIDSLPPRISIVSAGEPMWHGGLSAPRSLYIHADRPLLSENATSPLLHEIAHVLLPVTTADEHDWIDEGIAEYSSLEILRRSGTISDERFLASVATFARRGKHVDNLSATHASGAVTARAVAIFHDVDNELQSLTDGRADIFDLIRLLMQRSEAVGLADLRAVAAELTDGRPLTALDDRHVPGFGAR